MPHISEAEWEVMEFFWQTSPATASDAITALSEHTEWKPATVKSLINRLANKKALGFNQEGKTYYYFPLLSKEESLITENHSFLQRIYGGALKPMLVNFLKQEKLTAEDVEELKKILDERKE